MRKLPLLAFSPAIGLAMAWACSSGNGGGPSPPGDDAEADAAGDDAPPDSSNVPVPDATHAHCMLGDSSDPVALCTQKLLLQSILDNGIYTKGHGLPASWDSTTGLPNDDHTWQADLAFASSIASYGCNAGVYGDNEITGALGDLLPDVATVLEAELPKAPDGYDGEVYFRLLNAAAGLYYINENVHAQKLIALADDYGRAIQTKYAQTVAAGDGGVAQVVLGTTDVTGHVAYAPAQVVMGAAALLDMAVRNASDPDAGAQAAVWRGTAMGAIDYVGKRARDGTTGLFYQALVTSTDPGHDALGAGSPSDDALLTDVQAAVVLGLARAQDLVASIPDAGAGADAEALPTNAYYNEANSLVAAMNAAGLWDGAAQIQTPPSPGAYLEGLLPSAGAVIPNKTTVGNALLLGGFHRVARGIGVVTPVLGQLRAALIQRTPANSSLLSVVASGAGQSGYLRAASRDWHFAVDVAADGGVGGQEQGAAEYRADAIAAAIEGLTQIWHGRMNAPSCSN